MKNDTWVGDLYEIPSFNFLEHDMLTKLLLKTKIKLAFRGFFHFDFLIVIKLVKE